ncbi:PepSY domain-containing protein [Acaryochloris sp. CCMEE 5410]|uniref:PepSY domain-containing protein n=1 Tax=Acaryochloris sp. CCMEE 5410 TaxID=310037 RepID=UPI00024847FB|nr:PepSY domain-containing protein [Acaryochloris sp. CCMEE 5410]KAI9129960.1 PepSY domain-containing protein [Acaryochloris sp. CCMEE 5410]KAI9130089.1 PepSY domain-containing protein [Acaryochloris sp. CCMEE 5410]
MSSARLNLRRLHKATAPLMCVPLLLTLLTGVGFQMAAVSGKGDQFLWLLDLHRGKFGRFNLELVYPFLNALGLLVLIITGTLMWLKQRQPRVRR